MSRIETKRIASWNELATWLEKYRERDWLFRGEVSPKFKSLRPKVGRVSKEPGSARKVPYSEQDERRAHNEFKKAALPYIDRVPASDIEWMALAQHHGLPTRLLDWTDSVLIAAFFAVEKTGTFGNTQDGGAVIYCVRGLDEIDEATEGSDGLFSLSSVKLYLPPHISPRMTVQRSVFTVHPSPTQDFSHPNLERWVIERDACWPIKRSLNAAGVTYSSLFPDLDGICRQIGWLYKWGFFSKEEAAAR